MDLGRLRKIFESTEKVRAAFLFGSIVEGRAGPLSDYDFAVLPKPGYERGLRKLELISELLPELARELGVGEDQIDLVFLVGHLPEELWYRATIRGVPIYVESDELLSELRLRGLRFLDFRVHVERLGLRRIALEALERRGRS